MTERKGSVADGLTVCWAVIFTVWCAVTGHLTWWLLSTGPLVVLYLALASVRKFKEKRK